MDLTEIYRPSTRTVTIGRSPESDVQIDLPMVSWHHARIVYENGNHVIEDLDSTNGTSIGSPDRRIRRAILDPSTDVYFGTYKIPADRLLEGRKIEIGGSLFHDIVFTGESMELGRDPSADIPLDYPMISRRHARLTRSHSGGIWVEDLGSRNGTFVAGERISTRTLVRPGQEIGLGTYRFRLTTDGKLQQADNRNGLSIEAKNVEVFSNDGRTQLVMPVSFTVLPGEFVALMGSSGAGKTTLIKALNGYTTPSKGTVLYNGVDINKNSSFRSQIGYVPQDEIMHTQLTVEEALRYYARLRTDLEGADLDKRVNDVLHSLNMWQMADKIIGSPEKKLLSGGQRKRVNIALELMCGTPVLFLDEPTSGLSSEDADEVVALLRRISKDENKPILTTIHQPSLRAFKMFDHLIVLGSEGNPPGRLMFFGPAFPDSIHFFNPEVKVRDPKPDDEPLSPEQVLSGLKAKKPAEWARLYQGSKYKRKFVDDRQVERDHNSESNARSSTQAPLFSFVQWRVLMQRGLKVKRRDQLQMLIVLLQAPLFALLVCLVYFPLHLDPTLVELSSKLAGVHFLLVVAAIWFGCNNAARDIVGEWTIYKRERIGGLSPWSYVFSKLTILFGICLLQCASLLSIVSPGKEGIRSAVMMGLLAFAATYVYWPDKEEKERAKKANGIPVNGKYRFLFARYYPFLTVGPVAMGILLGYVCSLWLGLELKGEFLSTLGILFLSSMIGVGLGLCISALSKTNESAVALLPVVLLPIIALGGGMRPTYLIDHNFRWVTDVIPSRWAFEANLLQEVQSGGWTRSNGHAATTPMPDLSDPVQVAQTTADKSSPLGGLILMGDLAEPSIPRYLISWSEGDDVKTARAFPHEVRVVSGKQVTATDSRHSWLVSAAVLGTMFTSLVIAVLLILHLRDREPI